MPMRKLEKTVALAREASLLSITGYSHAQIARQLNISRGSVHALLRDYAWGMQHSEQDLANARAARLTAFSATVRVQIGSQVRSYRNVTPEQLEALAAYMRELQATRGTA